MASFLKVSSMLAVGHLSVAYLLIKSLNRGKWPSMNIPFIWTFSLLPDLDLLIPGIRHMGPTHSLTFAIAVFTFLILYKGKETMPYFLAFVSHTIFGDLITNHGVQFLWPLTQNTYQIPLPFSKNSNFSENLQLILFGLFLIVYLITKDYSQLKSSNITKLSTLIPLIALTVPVALSFPFSIPIQLIPPHLIFIALILQPFYPASFAIKLQKIQ